MRHNKKGRKLNRNSSHRKALMRNMATNLFRHGSIRTTLAKAKETRPYAEKLISKAISGTLADKRLIIQRLNDRAVAHHLINQIAPELKDRPGGFLRIIKLGYREGDGAEMAMLEIVSDAITKKATRRKKSKASKSTPKEGEKPDEIVESSENKAEDESSKAPHEHEKSHSRDEQTKEHLTRGSKAEGTRRSSKPPQKAQKPGNLNRGTSHPKTPPPASQDN